MTRLAQFGVGTRDYAGFVAKAAVVAAAVTATKAGGGPKRRIRTLRAPYGTPAQRREEEIAIIHALETELVKPVKRPLIGPAPITDDEAAVLMLLL